MQVVTRLSDNKLHSDANSVGIFQINICCNYLKISLMGIFKKP